MRKFLVRVTERAVYQRVIAARNMEEACTLAEDDLINRALTVAAPWSTDVIDRDCEATRASK